MYNPFLLQNFKSQGFSYILFADENQKKAFNDAEISIKTEQNKIPSQSISVSPAIVSPAEQYRTAQRRQAENSAASLFSKTNFANLANAQTDTQTNLRAKPQANPKTDKKGKTDTDIPVSPLQENTLPAENWDMAWKEAAKRCNLPFLRPQNLSRQIVWTYKGLEEDLFTDSPSDKRRQLLAQIIKTLAFPKGTHIFLPYRLISDDGQSELAVTKQNDKEYSFFWSAVNHIRPRVLIVFGEDARTELSLPPMLPTQKHTIMPVTVYALDNIMLYADSEQENAIMKNFLLSNLKAFA